MKDLEEKVAAGEPLMRQAMDALRSYNESKRHASPEVEERLRIEAESLFGAVQEYQRRSLGFPVTRFTDSSNPGSSMRSPRYS
ncbi:hypothetical protein KC131_26880 [Pseudomonas sp. JQ170]|uniref:hypothetical protein n=1 Tax=unclassified Pseudomonas TaxID=196821 RepID=UPI00264B73A9|nr:MULTISPECIES: hypothetical protein [unclassified Pseudomonas]MDN7144273.1 hypothetical protein [Pseudomonas sp. JQ170]WRO74172.1 hypothetical protein U9R80_16750 [Pseudomonas sp. 170C]